MRVRDIMSKPVIGILPSASIARAAQLMVDNRISGLPVIDSEKGLVGMITEGDLIRRSELGTETKRSDWRSFFTSSGKLAAEYTQSHGRRVGEVMSPEPVTIGADASLDEAVRTMQARNFKRLPVVEDGKLVGILSRSDLVRTLLRALPDDDAAASDRQIEAALRADLSQQPWIGLDRIRIDVRDGIVDLDGTILDERQRTALRVAAENVEGVKRVVDHLVFIEPMSGLVVMSPDEPNSDAA